MTQVLDALPPQTQPYSWSAEYQDAKPQELLISGDVLLQEEACAAFLHAYGEVLKAPCRKVTASLFAKSYVGFISEQIHGFLQHDRVLELTPAHIRIRLHNGALSYQLRSRMEVPLRGTREERREQMYRIIVQELVSPLFACLSAFTGVAPATLWAHLSYSLSYWRDQWLHEADARNDKGLGERIASDCAFVLQAAPGSWFGAKDNPLTGTFRYAKNALAPDQPIRLRSKCCLRSCLPGDQACYTCPFISEEARQQKYARLHRS